MALVMSVTVVFAASYAWLVLSNNPVATGIQVAIGGGNTILIAPNIREELSDGTVCNYPGNFSDKMNFGKQNAYEYLQTIGNLNPVSTVNGVDWILPVYYSGIDPEVQEGMIPSGTIKDISEFFVDSELSYANIPADQTAKIREGHYVYLDFWVASPGGDYKLRVSTGVDELDGGSFVIDLMEPEISSSGHELSEAEGNVASAVRVGFLANDLLLLDDSMQRYINSSYYDERFTSLKGLYQEPNSGTVYLAENRFTIYEPNADDHAAIPSLDGYYVETKPLGLTDGQIAEHSTRDNLTVQKESTWAMVDGNADVAAIEQVFQTALYAYSEKNMDSEELANLFYGNYLQGQISPYVKKGGFIQRTGNLYAQLSANGGKVSPELLADQNHGAADGTTEGATVGATAGATIDVYIIELERNVPQRIRMFIWLEGQDVDCVNSINASRFAVNIELASGDE